MIIKDMDDRATEIATLEGLVGDGSAQVRDQAKRKLIDLRRGIAGEREAAHFLKREFDCHTRVLLINDLRVEVAGEYTQIDHLMLHRFQGAAWVLETKNYSGRLSCNEHGDWTAWYKKGPVAVPSPVAQAERQCKMLRRWFAEHQIEAIHTIHPVVLISPSSSIDRRQLPNGAHVVKSDHFSTWWQEQADKIGVSKALGMIGRHMLKGASDEQFKAIGERLVQAHVPRTTDWHAKLGISENRTAASSRGTIVKSDKLQQDSPSASRPQQQVIATSSGEITIRKIADDCFALRNDKNPALIEIVRTACKGHGRWNPKYQNWIVPHQQLEKVVASITAALPA